MRLGGNNDTAKLQKLLARFQAHRMGIATEGYVLTYIFQLNRSDLHTFLHCEHDSFCSCVSGDKRRLLAIVSGQPALIGHIV